MSLADRIWVNPSAFFRLFLLVTGLGVLAAMASESSSAHEMACDGNPVPVRIKSDCCGEAEEHRLDIRCFLMPLDF
jgi:hypothetical protein